MPHYVPNPENPGQHIDVIELLRRDPHALPPVNIEGLLKRDTWTRQEALLILAGLSPRNVVHGGMPIGTIGAGIVYLDGTTSAQLDAQGLQHPRAQEWLPEFDKLKGYAAGQDMGERKPSGDWMAWAESKGFTPYWLRLPAPAGETARMNGKTEELAAPIRAQLEQQEAEKKAAGRYTLEEAANLLEKETGESAAPMLDKLKAAAKSGVLITHAPGKNARYTGKVVREFYEEAHAEDLNAWLDANEPRIAWRFPEPKPEAAPAGEAATIAGPGTPAEQWKAARGDMLRRAPLAVATVKACQDNKAEAARRLGTKTGPLYRALNWAKKNAAGSVAPSVAGVAPMYKQLTRKPHKT